MVLAATGPLVQAWFVRRYPGRSPYPLYAVSNIGSFLALLSYPFVLEPRLSLSETGGFWSLAFGATCILVLACAGLATRDQSSETGSPEALPDSVSPSAAMRVLWLLLSGVAVVILMGVTNHLCQDIASVPFLWILPLGVYLLTFVLCFSSGRVYRRSLFVSLVIFTEAFPLLVNWLAQGNPTVLGLMDSVQVQAALTCSLLFGGCMILHGELHRLRPDAGSLTTFYMCVSGGGALGGLFVGVVAPHLFDSYYELPLGLALGVSLLLVACWKDTRGWLRRGAPRWRWAAVMLPVLAIGVGGGASLLGDSGKTSIHRERNFFGVLHVDWKGEGKNKQLRLYSGTTLHGVQYQTRKFQPTSYYGTQTGIGMVFAQGKEDPPRVVGVVGLGIGTLAAYGRLGDQFYFYEIDPAVVQIAGNEDYFSFLSQTSADVEIVLGDGRISLETQLEGASSPSLGFFGHRCV